VAYLYGGEPAAALHHLQTELKAGTLAPVASTTQWLLGQAWLALDAGLPFALRQESLQQAADAFLLVEGDFPNHRQLWEIANQLKNPPEFNEKSPWLAGLMSAVVPGSGSFYVGRPQEGALAFFVNAVLLWATQDALANNRPVETLLAGTAALAFYSGNIYAAVNGAHKHNNRLATEWLQTQQSQMGTMPFPSGISIEWRF